MNKNYREKVHKINCLTNDLNALYHRAALKFGLSDSEMFILYMIIDKNDCCLLHDICFESGISKQTVNSAVRKLEGKGLIYLEKYKGKNKQVFLTKKGKDYCENTVVRLFKAECAAFDDWNEEETKYYVELMEKYNKSFKKQIDIL